MERLCSTYPLQLDLHSAYAIIREETEGTEFMSTITIEVDSDAARANTAASAAEKRKVQLLLNLRLRELVSQPPRPLSEVMDQMGAEAQARGLTPEILKSLLNEE